MIIANFLLLWGLVFGINIFPILMPPTWMVLAFFYVKDELPLLPTVIIGASAATLGRISLAYISKKYLKPLLPQKQQEKLFKVGLFIEKKQYIALPLLMVFYAFSPIPSNQFFIAAGLINANIRLMGLSFLLGRLFSYSFWVTIAHRSVNHLDRIFTDHIFQPQTYLIEIASFAIVYLFINFMINRAMATPNDKS